MGKAWLRARDASETLRLPTHEHGRTVAELLSQYPPVSVVTHSQDLRPALTQPRQPQGPPTADTGDVTQHQIDTQARGLVLVHGVVTLGGDLGWVLTTDTGYALDLVAWPESPAFANGRTWAVVSAERWGRKWVWRVEIRWPDEPQFKVPAYGDTLAESLFALNRRLDMLNLLDFDDLGVTDPCEQRWTYLALVGLLAGEPAAREGHVGTQPLAEWARDLLALSAPRKPWQVATLQLEQARKRSSEQAETAAAANRASQLPAPRLVKNARAAEEYVAEVLRALGFGDAAVTGHGSDGGVDVRASGAVAQVKMEAVPTGRPAVQNIFGIAAHEHKAAVFFSLAGYTTQALDWARDAGVACFEFELDGSVEARTKVARELLEGHADTVHRAEDGAAAEEFTDELAPTQEVTQAQAALDALGPAPQMNAYPRFDIGQSWLVDSLPSVEERFGRPTRDDAMRSPRAWQDWEPFLG